MQGMQRPVYIRPCELVFWHSPQVSIRPTTTVVMHNEQASMDTMEFGRAKELDLDGMQPPWTASKVTVSAVAEPHHLVPIIDLSCLVVFRASCV